MQIQAKQITKAREIRGLSITELADKVAVTRQSISYYEKGDRIPQDSVINQLSEALNFPVEYFYKTDVRFNKTGAAFYRTTKSSTAKSRTAIIRIGELGCEAYEYLSSYLNLPELDLPFLDFILAKDTLSTEDINNVAQITREYWGLGNDPIVSLLNLLESKGIIIVNGGEVGDKTDACFIPFNNRPVIVLGERDGRPGAAFRQNFSLAHELGHILLHRYITDTDINNKITLEQIEREANAFAGAFLLPEKTFLDSLLSTSLDFFLSLKKKWNTSIAAMVYRCRELGILSEQEYTNLQKLISYRRWRTTEPMDMETPIQKPLLFRLSVELLLKEKIVTKRELLDYFSLSIDDLAEFFALPLSLFSETESQLNLRVL